MFDAYKSARDTAQAAIDANYAATLLAVTTSHGTTTAPVRKTYRVTMPRNIVFPCCIIGQARGQVDDSSSRSLRTTVNLPVMVAVSGADPERLDTEIDDHITALVRLFAGTQHGEYLFTVEDFDADVPAPYNEANLLQTAVVNVTATVKEDRS